MLYDKNRKRFIVALTIILYVILTFITSIVGSVTGIGAGVILKPVLDILADYDVAVIGVLSSTLVLSMSLVIIILRLIKERRNRMLSAEYLSLHPDEKSVPVADEGTVSIWYTLELGTGAFVGGTIGQFIFGLLIQTLDSTIVKLIQNIILIAIIILILFYMRFKGRIKPLGLKKPVWFIIAGIFLGIIAALLGIGGGPLNIAIVMFMFGMSIKPAAYYSLVSILFSQLAKLMTLVITTGIPEADYMILPFMIVTGIAGAFVGAFISAKAKRKRIEQLFNISQVVIIILCAYNIISFFL